MAKQRNIKVSEVKNKNTERFANTVTVTVTAGKNQTVSIQGTLFGDKARIVQINDNRVDVAPRRCLLLCPHNNRPGVIGQVGSIMGAAGVNISGMQVSTTSKEDVNLMILTLDSEVPADVLKLITSMEEIYDAKMIMFK